MPTLRKISEMELNNTNQVDETVKRGRGRPKGSKNKPKLDIVAVEATEKRGRGRPKGSKNKPKEVTDPRLALYTCSCGNSIEALACAISLTCGCGRRMKKT